jgi:DNA-binding PadR family transcriptional regulator
MDKSKGAIVSEATGAPGRDVGDMPDREEDDACRGGGRGRRRGRYRRAVLEPAILLLLIESEAHGYDLIEQVTDLVGDQVCVDRGTLYRLLRSMEEQELLISSWEVTERGPNRRTYRVLPAGRDALARDLAELRGRASFLVSLADEGEKRLERT